MLKANQKTLTTYHSWKSWAFKKKNIHIKKAGKNIIVNIMMADL